MTNETLRGYCHQAFTEHGFVDPDPTDIPFDQISLAARTRLVPEPGIPKKRLLPCFDFDMNPLETRTNIEHTTGQDQKQNP